MTTLQRALYAHWISRLGRAKLNEMVAEKDLGLSTKEKAVDVVKASSEVVLKHLLLEGFSGFFHQTVYLRSAESAKTKANVSALLRIPEDGEPIESTVLVTARQVTAEDVRALLMVTEEMEFLTTSPSTGPLTVEIPFPVAIRISGAIVSVHTLTMQSTVETWGEILGVDLRRMLTFVRSDSQYDRALNFLREAKIDVGDYVDYSKAAVKLMKRSDVNTYSGTMEVKTVGSSKFSTVRGKGKKPLRNSMSEEFDKLVAAKRIIDAEIEMAGDYLGLTAGSKIALYPSVGKIAFRSNLEGCNPDGLVIAMAEN